MTSTTFGGAWIVRRRDGAVFGFCDHDRPLVVAGVTCEPSAALTPSEAAASLGLSVDEMDAGGALSSQTLTETDIAAGRWDGAEVEAYEVDWQSGSSRLIGRFSFGGIERSGGAFRVELRSRAAGLDRPQGRAFLNSCDARLGDGRCGVDLAQAGRRAVGTVTAVSGLTVTVSGVGSLASVHLSRGVARLTSGAAAGLDPLEIRAANRRPGGGTVLHVWRRPQAPVSVGDLIEVTVGCDKTFSTCRARFGNGDNFRGCPHMPGNAAVMEYARRGDPLQNGGSRYA